MSTAEENKTIINSLISASNATTGNNDTDLTKAVKSLIDGFGAGGNSGESNGNTESWKYVKGFSFANTVFPENYDLVLNLSQFNCSTFDFSNSNVRSVKLIIPSESREIQLYKVNVFNNCTSLEIADFSEFSTNFTVVTNLFSNCKKLKEILGELDFGNGTATSYINTFYNCSSLETVRFKQGSIKLSLSFAQSSLLSSESIQSIIDGLADLTDETAQTLTLHADVKAKLTEEQTTAITAKNWILA